MIIVLKPQSSKKDIDKIKERIMDYGCQIHESVGKTYHLLGLVGDTSKVDPSPFQADSNVEKLIYVQEPYKKANRLFHPEDTIINVDGMKIGDKHFSVMAGPCSVESSDQLFTIAESVKNSGASFIRGGAFKPRSSPYSFQGLGIEGLKILKNAKEKLNIPIISEVLRPELVETFIEYVDVIQIGARNMQNFDLLKEVGKTNKPVLLKRGLSSTIEELLLSAEYIMSEGNQEVILCERGIRTFESYTRSTLDLSAVPVIKKLSHLPVVVDPSHAAGIWWLVEPLAKAALIVGADGLLIEVHNDPANAKSDGQQSIKLDRFDELMGKLKKLAVIENIIL